jgi:hypothetical protein
MKLTANVSNGPLLFRGAFAAQQVLAGLGNHGARGFVICSEADNIHISQETRSE